MANVLTNLPRIVDTLRVIGYFTRKILKVLSERLTILLYMNEYNTKNNQRFKGDITGLCVNIRLYA